MYVYSNVYATTLSEHRKLLYYEVAKLGHILYVDKTGFLRPGYIST